MKATMRNERLDTAKHNDRDFDLEHERNDGHIDVERQHLNVYWHCYQETEPDLSFYEAEKRYYQKQYAKTVQLINKRAKASRHKERITSVGKIYENARTRPEETILQIGNMRDHPSLEVFADCVNDFLAELDKYSKHVHVLDWAIHGDEDVPHAHIRKVYDYEDKDGVLRLSTDKALELEGFDRPEMDKSASLINNRKISFDNHMRQKWYDICIEHGIELDIEPQKDNITHYNKEEYIRQQAELEQQRLDQLKQQVEQERRQLEDIQRQYQEMDQKYAERKAQQKHLKREIEKDIKEYRKYVSEKHAKKFLKEQGLKNTRNKTITNTNT